MSYASRCIYSSAQIYYQVHAGIPCMVAPCVRYVGKHQTGWCAARCSESFGLVAGGPSHALASFCPAINTTARLADGAFLLRGVLLRGQPQGLPSPHRRATTSETPTGDAISRDDVPHVRAPAQNVSGICFLYMFDFFILYALNFPPCWLEFLRVFTYHSQPRKQSRDASRGLCKHRWYNTFEHGFAHASSQCPDLKYIDLLVQGPGDVLPTV
jgi:hypothetical protein